MSQSIPEPVPAYGGCLWPVDSSCLGEEWANAEPAMRERALALASSSLSSLTGNRVGGCPVTVRPCAPRAAQAFVPYTGASGRGWMNPGINTMGQWVNSCGCSGSCGCTSACEIALPAPVGEVHEVKVDGVVIDPEDYRIDNGHLLVWTGVGDCPFPATQNLSLPDTEPGTFSVTYLNAHPVDSLGAQAVGLLAMEFLRACKPKGKCSLPRTVTSMVRNGVSYQFDGTLFPGGTTGIDVVDAFIRLWNPGGLVREAAVWWPGKPMPRRTSAPRRPLSQGIATRDLSIRKGSTFAYGWGVTYQGEPIDDTWTAQSQVRESVGSDVILHTFQSAVNPDGSVVIGVPASESSTWDWTSGVYDIEVTNADGTVTLPVAQGRVRVTEEVTR